MTAAAQNQGQTLSKEASKEAEVRCRTSLSYSNITPASSPDVSSFSCFGINKGNLTLILVNPKEQHVKELSTTAQQLFVFVFFI